MHLGVFVVDFDDFAKFLASLARAELGRALNRVDEFEAFLIERLLSIVVTTEFLRRRAHVLTNTGRNQALTIKADALVLALITNRLHGLATTSQLILPQLLLHLGLLGQRDYLIVHDERCCIASCEPFLRELFKSCVLIAQDARFFVGEEWFEHVSHLFITHPFLFFLVLGGAE